METKFGDGYEKWKEIEKWNCNDSEVEVKRGVSSTHIGIHIAQLSITSSHPVTSPGIDISIAQRMCVNSIIQTMYT